ncbi:CHAT domain-containing protein [Marinilongibacter aquaticus]|uniref:CHAT domain-containing protein n=1 Tax=Marinilongibacter aquaticus TaxID=2975157 RepID=UPI0021BD67B8|nr:CHAT domain-containing protein [Marinilongibacter aquaticus]UBM58199.1 CHAT domain-containing protein [Marinilongibacter aquaticus]
MRILCCFTLLAMILSRPVDAQKIGLENQRNRAFAKFLSGELSKQDALSKLKAIHAEFEKGDKQVLKYETPLFVGAIEFYAKNNAEAFKILKLGRLDVLTKNDSICFKFEAMLASLYREENKLDSAQHYFDIGYAHLMEKPQIAENNPLEVYSFYLNYSYLLQYLGEKQLNLLILQTAEKLSKKLNRPLISSSLYNRLGLLYAEDKQFDKAIDYFKLAIQNSRSDFDILPRTLHLVDALIASGQWHEAAQYLQKAKNGLPKIKNGVEWQHVKLQTLEAKLAIHEDKKAAAKNVLAKTISEYQKPSKYLAEAIILLGDLSENAQEAKKLYNKALALCSNASNGEKVNFSEILFPIQYLEALQKRAQHEPDEKALKSLSEAVRLATDLKKNYPFQESKFELDATIRPMVSQILDLNTHSNSPDFLPWINKIQAASLNEALWDQKIKPQFQDDSLIIKEKLLQQELNSVWIAQANAGKTDSALDQKLNELKIEMGFLKRQLEEKNEAYFALKYQTNEVSSEELKKTLANDAAALSYFLTDSVAYVSLIDRREYLNLKINLPSSFLDQIEELKNALYTNPGLGKYQGAQAAFEIYKTIFEPLEPHLKGIHHLLIIRDSQLNLIPFEVLQDENKAYLIDRFSIFYDYSFLTYFRSKQKKFSRPQEKALAIAPYADNAFLLSENRDRNLGQLPFSSQEVDKIGGVSYKNQSASKNNFFEEYQEYGIIHFATHAQMDDEEPGKSFIAFYPDSTDYKLYTEELYSLSLQNTELVVLSACEAGNGKLQKGEGLISLARGFAYAGCPSTITTLWKAHDESSAWLASRLYHYLEKGWNKADALRQAKLDFRKSATGQEFNHPYYWANFILIGNDQGLRLPFWVAYKYSIISCSILVFVLIAAFVVRKKRA